MKTSTLLLLGGGIAAYYILGRSPTGATPASGGGGGLLGGLVGTVQDAVSPATHAVGGIVDSVTNTPALQAVQGQIQEIASVVSNFGDGTSGRPPGENGTGAIRVANGNSNGTFVAVSQEQSDGSWREVSQLQGSGRGTPPLSASDKGRLTKSQRDFLDRHGVAY
jgi:hypothetical protein